MAHQRRAAFCGAALARCPPRMRTEPTKTACGGPLRTLLRTFVSTNGGAPPPPGVLFIAPKAESEARKFFRLLGFEHQQKQAEGTSGMHAVAWVPVLLCSLCALPARKEQGKARTPSSKGEGEQSQARNKQAKCLTDGCVLLRDRSKARSSSKPDRDRERKADRVVEAKRARSTSTNEVKHGTQTKHIQHDAEAKHYVVSAWRRDAIVGCMARLCCSHTYVCFFFPYSPPYFC